MVVRCHGKTGVAMPMWNKDETRGVKDENYKKYRKHYGQVHFKKDHLHHPQDQCDSPTTANK